MKGFSGRVKLGDVCDIISGSTPKTSEPRHWGGDILWATPADLSDLDAAYISDTPRKLTLSGLKSCAATVLPENSVLLSSRAPIGHIAINTVPMATNQGFKSLVPDRRRLDPKFLYHWLDANRLRIQSLGNGATFKEVSKATVSNIEIPLPPIDEQRRISAILDKADALRQKRKKAFELLNSLTQSIFLEMFGNESNGSTQRVKLAEVCSKITDGTHQAPEWSNQGVPFLFVSNIRGQAISSETDKFVSEAEYARLTKHSPIEVGDVLYTAVGSYGNSAVVPEGSKFIFQRHIAQLKPLQSKVNPNFLSIILETPDLRRQADKVARGVAQKTVTLTSLKNFEIPLPNLKLQNEFSGRVEAVKTALIRNSEGLNTMTSLFSSLQHRAFSGQL